MSHFVYILTNRKNGTLYTGSTLRLYDRMIEHREGSFEGFSKKYGTSRLVWFHDYGDFDEMIRQEKLIKKWRRAWKIDLIEKFNPGWDDSFLKLDTLLEPEIR